ncbi:MAG: hypothetical protein RLZZ165_1856 [Bacteroidota bacterium]|jgi:mono/diheme cytochrome c family protein
MNHPIRTIKIGAFLGLAALMASCGRDPNDTGVQYAPEMYEAIPYEPYKQVRDSITPFANHQTMQAPPEGTVPRGGYLEGFEYPGGDSARMTPEVVNYPNPIPASPEVLKEGEVLYLRFCSPCHGKGGAGNGPVTKNPAIKPLPYDSDKLKVFTDGQIYHTIMYGRGVMGSYTSQIQYEDRWKIVHFVRTLQGTGAPRDSAAADSAATLGVAPADSNSPAGGQGVKGMNKGKQSPQR